MRPFCWSRFFCRSEHVRDGLSFDAGYLGVHIRCCGKARLWLTPAPCRSEHARDGLSFNAGYLGVHIRYLGNGHLWFRPYGESLGKTERRPAPSNQGLLPPSFGASLRLGMPSLRSCSVGPPRPAIHGLTRLTRHPAGLPTAQNLHSASRRGKRSKADQKPKRGEAS
jgi:hypothetical protein